mgnify:CR=1 FL=1
MAHQSNPQKTPMAKPPVPDSFFRQSAVVPFRKTDNGIEVLLITSRERGRWIVPKGVVEPDLTPAESALVEAYEEAGLKGRVVGKTLGSFTYEKWEGTCRVKVFAMEVRRVLDAWPEKGQRKRRWLPLAEAADLADDKPVGKMIRKLSKIISRRK